MFVSARRARCAALLAVVGGLAACCVMAPEADAQQPTAVKPPARVAIGAPKAVVVVGDSIASVTATPYALGGKKATSSSVVWRANPAGSIAIAAAAGSRGQRATIVGRSPGTSYAVATWSRSDKSVVADSVLITVTTPAPPPIDFAAAAHYYDDFSKYSSSAQLASGNARALGNFWFAPSGHDMGGMIPLGVSYDASEKAMRYDWPARANSTCSSNIPPGPGQIPAEITIGNQPRWLPSAPVKDVWIRFTSKESAGFAHGNPSCGGRSYKFFLVVFNNSTTLGRAGLYLGDGPLATQLSTRAFMDFNSPSAASGVRGGFNIGGDSTWGGSYRTWTIGIEHIGDPSSTFSVYLDGKLVNQIAGPFLVGQQVGPGWAITLEMGANINSGPDHAQARWWRELGVYTSKPSLMPLVVK